MTYGYLDYISKWIPLALCRPIYGLEVQGSLATPFAMRYTALIRTGYWRHLDVPHTLTSIFVDDGPNVANASLPSTRSDYGLTPACPVRLLPQFPQIFTALIRMAAANPRMETT